MKYLSSLALCCALCGLALAAQGENAPAANTPLETVHVSHRVADLADARIDESSGLAASRAFPGFLWTHNDSGDSARAFLLDARDGATKSVISLRGATALDWEDCAIATDDEKTSWLYLGDIGDNLRARPNITIYRLKETDVASDKAEQSVACESQTLRYPNGARDAETLLAAPGERIIIITKSLQGSEIYITPAKFENGGAQKLKKLGDLEFAGASLFSRLATGGDISADGSRLVVRTYTHAYEWTLNKGEDAAAGWWQRAPLRWVLANSKQGEAIAYDNDNSTLWATSEKTPTPLEKIQATP